MEFETLLCIVCGIPIVLVIANLFLRIVLGYWSPLFKWLLLGYLAIVGALITLLILYSRALEKSNEIERQKSTARSIRRFEEQLEDQLARDMFHRRDNSDLEQILRRIQVN